MENNNKDVCRFCLKLVHKVNVDITNEVMREMLSLLLIKLDLDVSEHPLICGKCSEVFDEIFLFKSKCLYTEDVITAQIGTNSKVSLRKMFIEIANKGNVNIGENEVICRLCINIPPNGTYIALGETGEETSLCRDMIQIHLPEMDLSITEKPLICEACHVWLKNYVSFATNCMVVEEKIKLYCDLQEINGPVDLACVPEFTEDKAFNLQAVFSKDLVIKQEEGSVMVKVEKVQDEHDYMSEGHFVDSSTSLELHLTNEEIEIKSENDTSEEIGDPAPSGACYNSGKSGFLNRKSAWKVNAKKMLLNCQYCEYRTRYKSRMIQHMPKHRDPREKRNFKCDKCLYQTDFKSNLSTHIMIHKDKSEVEMHKCENCEFETRYKSSMRHHALQHTVTHRDPRAERKFKCGQCTYKTDFKYHLRTHNLIHKDKSEVEMYKCDNCEYEAKHKGHLIRHLMVKHRDPRAERQFKCDKCPYETDIKYSLQAHNLIHKDKSEVKMYSCENCKYETRYKGTMKNHMRKHRDREAERKFKCDKCPYDTDIKFYLHLHNQRHQDKSEVKMYKCANCEYESKYRSSISKHITRKHIDSKAEKKFESDQ